jgi:hypothetical protein
VGTANGCTATTKPTTAGASGACSSTRAMRKASTATTAWAATLARCRGSARAARTSASEALSPGPKATFRTRRAVAVSGAQWKEGHRPGPRTSEDHAPDRGVAPRTNWCVGSDTCHTSSSRHITQVVAAG